MRTAASCFHFAIDAPRDVVARQQFRWTPRVLVPNNIAPALFFRIRSLSLVEVRYVVEHEALALIILQYAAFTTHAFSDQNSRHAQRPDHPSRMELDELHIHQLGARTVGQRLPVARVFPAVRRDLERPANTASSNHHRLRVPYHEVAAFAVVSERPAHTPGVHHQGQHRAFHVDFHALVDAVVLQRANHFQASAVADVRQTRITMAAEVALQNAAFLGTVEQRSPGFKLAHPLWRLFRVKFSHTAVIEILTATHRV